ncbi:MULTISPECIES: hypothetical protein [unclassified Pseudomonas]|uniref:hypothetical protein n=1 Tax=unclassified Pseudomonas TaxID=196821 RepID=UPI0020977BC4|nr:MULTISPECIES: hypothetical protein [unclassified Pseudomonas]MCO7522479.1 hypothetical protein [Pseudomonas sp. 1]MCO7543087.1 hypothetical protein [Pseudomonas sp. VA159-2]
MTLSVEVVFWGVAIMLAVTVLYGHFYSKRNGINMNTFPGLFELFGHVFKFKDRVLSGLFIFSMYGGAIIGVGLIVLIFYAQSKGCNIHVKGSVG